MIARKFVSGSISMYQLLLSPLLPRACRFEPSCSEFARDAVESYGVWYGGLLSLGRIARCHPFSRGGFDPVPPRPARHAALSRSEPD